MTSLRLEGLTLRYGSGPSAFTAVDGVDLAVAAGQTHGVVGESGSGKSSLARAVVGLVRVASGRVMVGDEDLTNPRGRRLRRLHRRVQMVFQDPYASLNPRLPVGDAIGEAVALHRDLPRAARAAETLELLALVGLDPAAAPRYPHQFSGGQRQRIAIARAVATAAPVLILDEVTSALDVSVQANILNLLKEIQRTRRLTYVFISHDLAVVRYMSDRVSVMYLGRIVETALAPALFAAPRHPYTVALVEAVPRLVRPGTAPRQGLRDEVPDPRRPPAGCRFHTRCPCGPLARADRALCQAQDPAPAALAPDHRAACHFPRAAP